MDETEDTNMTYAEMIAKVDELQASETQVPEDKPRSMHEWANQLRARKAMR